MKKIFTLMLFSVFAFTSCSDDGQIGPPGPQGPPGADGQDAQLATIFEITADFDYEEEAGFWTTDLITFSDFTDVEVFEEYAVLVYRLDAVGELEDGIPIDEWSLLPQNFFTDEGTIQYVFNHTYLDTEIFIDGNYDLSGLGADFTSDQIFRVVIIPADFFGTSGVEMSNIEAIMSEFNLQESDIKKSGFPIR